jgi:glutamate synthase domain-containing protein 2
MRRNFLIFSAAAVLLCVVLGMILQQFFWMLLPLLGLIGVGLYDMIQKKHTIWRNFPLVGRGRMLVEILRPPFQQYFIESETDGRPVNRMFRSVVYQRAKNELDTNPFGTKVDVYRIGYEWMDHSLSALHYEEKKSNLRVKVGGPSCTRPYNVSLLNISAMSYGALSNNAIEALNGGAKKRRLCP